MERKVRPGDSFRYFSKEGELRLTLLVLEVEPLDDRFSSRVLVLDATELARDFRAGTGETTTWTFDARDPEWKQLERVL